ncbi:MAG: sugar phosphate isomerase/epimerase family protein [Salinivenus sp.]|uniref:sugar phosphate isomerase/epimerase family protein n=1 Tax=Salinibacter sp. TaxID=2065818 RepID=UPI002FC3B26A
MDRRDFTKASLLALTGLSLAPSMAASSAPASAPLYRISLAQWSLHSTLFDGELDNLDFARTAREEFGIGAVEYVNQFFMDQATNQSYLKKMKRRADNAGVDSLLIMCDSEGSLGHPDASERAQAVENHHKWVDAAKMLGCHSIRVNAATNDEGSYEEQMKRAADGLRQLTEYAAPKDINVIVENHGGLSSNGEWLAGVMETVDHSHCGTLPDFGNFTIREGETFDRYEGVRLLMPHAKGVSAKTFAFNEKGFETTIDYPRIMRIVLEAGYHGHVGIEYEGDGLDEYEGIRATKILLERTRTQLRSEFG